MAGAPQFDERLRGILERVFADGVLTSDERGELQALWREARLTVPVVRETFHAFLRTELAHALADGIVTDAERERLRTIIRELRLPPPLVPEEIARLLG